MNIGKRITSFALAIICAIMLVGPSFTYAKEVEHNYRDEELVYPDNKALHGYDIVFVVDNSGSIWKEQSIRDAALRTVADLAVGSDVRIGAVYFGTEVYRTFKLTSVEDQASYEDVLYNGLTESGKEEANRDTNIGKGLEAGLALFEDQDTKRERIIILLSDGINEDRYGSASYKAAADQKTLEQVKVIKEKGYPIYCAFIKKNYGDEEYLRNLVNYFDSDNTYDNRLVTVSPEDINMLADCMAGIFYDLNGGMKYKKLNLDSNGKVSFYIPDLHVTKLQIYLNNEHGKAALTDPKGDQREGWSEGTSSFFTIDDPESGTWNLAVNSDATVTGTIAYYTDICMKTELLGDVMKGKKVDFNVNFYDSQEKPIPLDGEAEVTGSLNVAGTASDEAKVVTSGETGVAKEVSIPSPGELYGKVYIRYDEFIDLSYTVLKDKEVITYGPSAIDYTGMAFGLIPGFPSAGVLKTTLKLGDYVSDPDSDLKNISIKEVTSDYQDHKSDVAIENGKLVLTSSDGKLLPAYVEGTILLADEDDQVTEMNYRGYLINMTIVLAIAAIVLLIILSGIVIAIKRSKKRRELLHTFGGYVKSFNEQKAIAAKNLETCKALMSNEAEANYEKDLKQLEAVLEEIKLPEDVASCLNISKPIDSGMMNRKKSYAQKTLEKAAQVCEFAEKEGNVFGDYTNMKNGELASRMKHISTTVKNMIRENSETQGMIQKLQASEEVIIPDAERVKDELEFLTFIKDMRIEYNMSLKIKRKTAVIMKNRKTFYSRLDDASMLNLEEEETLYDYYGIHTGIVFLPFQQKDKNRGMVKGVIAVSDKEFASRDINQSEDETVVGTSVVIPAGCAYRLEIERLGTVFVELD